MRAWQLTITAAKHGGFLVTGSSDYGEPSASLFAGDLNQVLKFAEEQLSPGKQPVQMSTAEIIEGLARRGAA